MANNAITLDGSTQFIKISNYSALDGLTNFTFEGWFKQNASGGNTYARAMVFGDNSTDVAWLQTENATPSQGVNFGVEYSGTNADGYRSDGVFSTSAWTHVALVHEENAKARVYVNGTEITYSLQQTPTGTYGNPSGDNLYVGVKSDEATKHFKGDVGCFRLWNVARTQAEISANYQYYLNPAYETGLILNVNMDEESGTGSDNDAPSSNDAVFTGSPSWTTGATLTAKPYIEQEGFRFRADDGDEDGATWLAVQDTDVARAEQATTRLRVLLNASGDPTAKNFQLEYKLSSDSTYTAVSDEYTNQGDIVDEDMASTPGTGTLNGNATYVSGYMRLTEASNGQDGSFYYTGTLPDDFTVDFDMYADGSADGNCFFFGTTGYSGNEETADGGYRIYASEYHSLVAIRFNSSIIASASYSNLGNATWRDFQIVKVGNTFTININSTEVLEYTDSTRTLGGSYYGWGARTGGLNAEHRVRNLLLTDNVTGGVIVHSASTYLPTPTHKDDFENNNFTNWNSTSLNSGDLSTSTGSALHGSYGMASLVNDTTDQYVQQEFADNTTFRCRFYFDPNSISMTNGDEMDIVATYNESWGGNFIVKFGQSSGNYYVAVGERTDDAWSTYLGAYTITDAPHLIEVSWSASTGAGNNDGTLQIWVDGTLKGSTTTIDNDTGEMHYVQLGSKAKDAGTSGTMYFDDWACNTTGEILGEPFTTAQLTAPSGKTTGDFTGGKYGDSENPVDDINLGADEYTEVEWSIEATADTTSGQVYDFRVTDAGSVIGLYTVTPQLTIGNTQTASVAPVSLTLTIPEVTATAEYSATVAPITATLTIPSVTATYVYENTATVAPLATTLTIPAVTATYDSIQTASVAPISAQLTIPAVTATHILVSTSTVAPLTATLTIPAVTATYASIQTATVAPVTTTLTIPAITATYVYETTATVASVTTTLTVPAITATYVYVNTASVAPVTLTFTMPAVSADYSGSTTASVSPVTLTLTIPAVSATYTYAVTATVASLSTTLTIPAVTATYDSVLSATVAPATLTLTVVETTATYYSVQSASVTPATLTLTIPITTATYESIQTAGVSPLALALAVNAVTATYSTIQTASVSPVQLSLTIPAVTATYIMVATAGVSPLTLALNIPTITAVGESSIWQDANPIDWYADNPQVFHNKDDGDWYEDDPQPFQTKNTGDWKREY